MFRFSFPRCRFLSVGLSIVGFACCLVFVGFIVLIAEIARGLEIDGSFRRGSALPAAIGNMIFSAMHGLVSIVCLWEGLDSSAS